MPDLGLQAGKGVAGGRNRTQSHVRMDILCKLGDVCRSKREDHDVFVLLVNMVNSS